MVQKQYGIVLCVLLSVLLVVPFVAAQETDCIYYFTSTDCKTCAETDSFINDLSSMYLGAEIEQFEVYYNEDHALLLENYFETYAVPENSQGIPAVFMSGSYLVGNTSILSLLEGRIRENRDPACPSLDQEEIVGIIGTGTSPGSVFKTLGFGRISVSAFIDGFHMEMIALVIILLALLSLTRDEKTILQKGGAFIVVVAFMFLLAGINVMPGFSNRIPFLFSKFIALCAIVFGLIHMKSFLQTWDDVLKKIPLKIRKNAAIVRKFIISVYGFMIVGVIGSFFTIGKTEEVFNLLSTVFSRSGYKVITFPLIIYYIIIAMLPFIVVLILYHFGHTKVKNKAQHKNVPEHKLDKWHDHYKRVLQFGVHGIIFVLGVILLFA
ncbi:hypothetical protein COV17_00630 [Candidatus Woesearchaeota archaeon CG10_big_fil_rev_8_21_14_0_10_36_11]|nr:MAG: hypothetical protein COV17_00630 [Candidatus Woesearchaeota archaeon CG10_big_fil_rev_8_21_14_0_10_36_11]